MPYSFKRCAVISSLFAFGQGGQCNNALPVYLTISGDTQQTQIICITFVQRRPNVFDVIPTLYTCHTDVWRLLGTFTLPLVTCYLLLVTCILSSYSAA